jgi:hypothetical protein
VSRQLSFTATGDSFRPSQAGLKFDWCFDAGAIATSGKYKGQPMPFGRASLGPPEGLQGRDSLQALCRAAKAAMPSLTQAGATDFAIWVVREYTHQCNEELSAEELSLISSLNCALCYSAYQVAADGT